MAEEARLQKLYTKLYDKYKAMKEKKDSVMEELNLAQETKFRSFVEASDETIELLKNENDRLSKQVSELRRDLSTLRSTKDDECIQYQSLLMEENKKNKELMEEIERLLNLQREGQCCQAKTNIANDGSVDTPENSQDKSVSLEMSAYKRKRGILAISGGENTVMLSDSEEVEHAVSAKRPYKHTTSVSDNTPACCKRVKVNSGSAVSDDGPASCFFRDLVECIVGLKFSCVAQNEEIGISALHPSSGYSFSLTWVDNSDGEPELLYRVLSLGTFERVAPEWTRDVLKFGTSMCPIFFQRVSRVIKLSH